MFKSRLAHLKGKLKQGHLAQKGQDSAHKKGDQRVGVCESIKTFPLTSTSQF